MNPHTHLIKLNTQIKTTEIQSAEFNKDTGKWIIRFHASEKNYIYNPDKVEFHQNPETLNPDEYRFFRNNEPLYQIQEVLKFDEEYHFWFKNGDEKVYHGADMEIVKNCMTGITEKEAMGYFRAISEVVSLRAEDGEAILGKQLDKMGFVGGNVVLSSYLNPQQYPLKAYESIPLIFPFGCNESQKKAVELACTNQMAVVEGPPGTGKTQTVLNIIANLLVQGKTVAVVSDSDSATLNVYEKLGKHHLDYLCAFLGRHSNKTSFIENQKPCEAQAPTMTTEQWDGSLRAADEAQKSLTKYLVHQNEYAQLETEYHSLELEQKHFHLYVEETFGSRKRTGITLTLSSTQVLRLKVSLEEYARERGRENLSWIQKLRLFIGYHIQNRMFLNGSLEDILTEFEWQYYDLRMHEIRAQQDAIQKTLGDFSFEEKKQEMEQLSLAVLNEKLAQKFAGYVEHRYSQEDFKHPDEVLRRYPVILSTTHSIRNSLNGALYDYVIVDEASQVNLVTGVLAMSCARNMVVVGDEKQLPNIIKDQDRKKINKIEGSYSVPGGLHYGEYNLLTSVRSRFPEAAHVMLREHYRCHPRIIQFCNHKFYQDQLIIMTEDLQEEDVLKVYRTVAGNHARGRVNQRQIDEIKSKVLPELLAESVKEEDIGIISPYRDQATATAEEVQGHLAVDTVHKFQGREKEAIIIATVDNEITEFTDKPKLLNVAVSRAISKLRLVVSDNEKNANTNIGDLINYIAYEKGEIISGNVFSVFDLLYEHYREVREEYLRGKRRISKVESENLFYYFLKEFLLGEKLEDLKIAVQVPLRMIIKTTSEQIPLDEEELKFVQCSWSHVDFLLYRKSDRIPVLAIEVDGAAYHKAGSEQKEVRDKKKDSIFEKTGLKLLRMPTTGSGEAERLRKALAADRQ